MAYKPILKRCELCGNEFWAKHPTGKYCSRQCVGSLQSHKGALGAGAGRLAKSQNAKLPYIPMVIA